VDQLRRKLICDIEKATQQDGLLGASPHQGDILVGAALMAVPNLPACSMSALGIEGSSQDATHSSAGNIRAAAVDTTREDATIPLLVSSVGSIAQAITWTSLKEKAVAVHLQATACGFLMRVTAWTMH